MTNMPDTKHVVNIAIMNMARFGTEMACFRFMLNSGISLIALFTIYYNVTKKHRGNGGRNDARMMDTGAGTLQAGAVWDLPFPSTSNVWHQPYMHIPAKFRLAKSSPSVNFRCRTRHYTFSLRCSSLPFNNFQNHKNVRRMEISLKGQTS